MLFHVVLVKFLNFLLFANKKRSFGGVGVPILDILSILRLLGWKKLEKCVLNDFLNAKPDEMVKTNAKVPK